MRLVLLVLLGLLAMPTVAARDLGQWDQMDASIRAWFMSLKQPDNPQLSCCGEADAYWADSFETRGDQYVAIITDERTLPHRQPRAVGTRILIPNYKIKYDQSNPTGHGVVFLKPRSDDVFCFLPPGGG